MKEILALEEGINVNKKELSNEDASKLFALASASGASQPAELVSLLETVDVLANAGLITTHNIITSS